MKLKLLISGICILFCSGMYAQDNIWFDADFNENEWLDAFEAVSGEDIRKFDPGSGYDLGEDVEVNGFKFNGTIHKHIEPFTSVCGRTFQYSFRLRNNNPTYIEFPEVENAGRLHVYVRNMNAEISSFLTLQQEDEYGIWQMEEPLHRWDDILGYEYYGDGINDMHLIYDINVNEPVKLRLRRHQQRFMQVFRVVLEKYGYNSSSTPGLEENMDPEVFGKTLRFSENINGAELFIYDYLGKQVFNVDVSSNEITLNSLNDGIYILKLKTKESESVKKIVLK